MDLLAFAHELLDDLSGSPEDVAIEEVCLIGDLAVVPGDLAIADEAELGHVLVVTQSLDLWLPRQAEVAMKLDERTHCLNLSKKLFLVTTTDSHSPHPTKSLLLRIRHSPRSTRGGVVLFANTRGKRF